MNRISFLRLIQLFVMLCISSNTFAANRVIDLHIDYKNVNFTGKIRRAIAVNNQIPGPTLHFKEGDSVTINVYNHLDKPTTVHWHGILVPWQMDGVEGVSQKGIPPDTVFHYQFTLKQAGTYWYHAHAGLQEQSGLYGAIIIDPIHPASYHYTKDYVVVLSDWSNTYPDQILANLKKTGDYYDPRFPLQPSLTKFIYDFHQANCEERKLLLNDYLTMQQSRMSIYDLNDIAYDAFLLNGRSNNCPWTGPVNVGDIVRLRFIGASANSIFRVKIQNTNMQMVHVQGNDIQPYQISDFSIAPGETYDVLVKIEKNNPYIIYAESRDTVGAAYGALTTAPSQIVNYQEVIPFKEPKPVTRDMMSLMMGKMYQGTLPSKKNMHAMHMTHAETLHQNNHTKHQDGMNHNTTMDQNHIMSMPTEPSIIGDKITSPNSTYMTSVDIPYQHLKAAVKTNDPNKPIKGIIKMELFGYMDRFIWFINGEPEYKAHPIMLEPGNRYRIIFTNHSMMRHPMHIHGHWFILRKGENAFDPLLHTIDVPPGATITADLDTDASGQWFFHCHMIYHMISGMSRTFQYTTLIDITKCAASPEDIVKNTAYQNRPIVRVDEVRPIDISLVKHPMAHPLGLWMANFLDVGEDSIHNVQEVTFKGLYGPDYHKLELFTNDAELNQGTLENADIDIFYWHLLSQFWAVKGGANYFYRPAIVPYWQPGIGIEGLMPYFIDTDVRGYYYSGSAKADLELSRDTQITNNFFIRLGVRGIFATKTVVRAQLGNGLNQMRYTARPFYRLAPGLSIFAEYEHDKNYGAFKNLQQQVGQSAIENTLTFGFAMLL